MPAQPPQLGPSLPYPVDDMPPNRSQPQPWLSMPAMPTVPPLYDNIYVPSSAPTRQTIPQQNFQRPIMSRRADPAPRSIDKSRRTSIIDNPMEAVPLTLLSRGNSMRTSTRRVFLVMRQQDASPDPFTSTRPPQMSRVDEMEFDDSDSEEDEVESDIESLSMTPTAVSNTVPPTPPVNEAVFLFNYNSRFEDSESAPGWYIAEPKILPRGDLRHQCGTCRHINISYLYNQQGSDELPHADDYVRLGSLADIIAKFSACGLYHFFMRLMAQNFSTTLHNRPELIPEEYSIYPHQFKEYYRVPGLFLCRGPSPEPGPLDAMQARRPSYLLSFREIHSCCEAPGTGRYVKSRDTIDFEWVKSELDLCEERSVGRSRALPVQIRVIDVKAMCIVDREPWDDYVTLSYVWGDARQVRLNWAIEHILREPQGLKLFEARLPATIRDAIELTRRIGQRYLWVDVLCIIQDDDEDKAVQIRNMGKIYRTSILTIQARCGDDANYGLPGVRRGTRQVRQILGIGGAKAICNVLPMPEDLPSRWETRAWTLQESVLSQRKLLITNHSCEFWCGHTATNEDVHCRHKGWPVGAQFRSMLFFKNHDSSYIPTGHESTNFTFYTFLVELYTPREMTRPEDAENALLGIFDSFNNWFDGEIWYGLPDREIEAAMLWVPVGRSRRRVRERDGRPLFPSWSWLGWEGPVGYPWRCDRFMPITTRSCPLRWRITLPLDSEDEEDNNDQEQIEWFANHRLHHDSAWKRSTNDPWVWTNKDEGGDLTDNPICWDSLDRDMIQCPDHPHRINIRSLVASFRLSGVVKQREGKYGEDLIHEILILDERGIAVGAVVVPGSEHFTPVQEKLFGPSEDKHDFVVLTRGSVQDSPLVGLDELEEEEWWENWSEAPDHSIKATSREAHPISTETPYLHPKGMFDTRLFDDELPYCLFTVLMLMWDTERDVAYRAALGRIHINAFMLAKPTKRAIALE